MKLINLLYKDIFLMSLSFGLSPFGRHHLGTSTKGEQSQTYTFQQTDTVQQGLEGVFAWVSYLKSCLLCG